jgi:two-component system cell cycle response regulator CtrA
VEVNGARVHLTGKEYQMLELLSLRKGTTLTKEMFLNHLYGGMDEPEIKIIDVFMCKLRKKLAGAWNRSVPVAVEIGRQASIASGY